MRIYQLRGELKCLINFNYCLQIIFKINNYLMILEINNFGVEKKLSNVGLKIIHDGDARTFVRTRIRLLPDMRRGVMQTSRGKQNILAGAELGTILKGKRHCLDQKSNYYRAV